MPENVPYSHALFCPWASGVPMPSIRILSVGPSSNTTSTVSPSIILTTSATGLSSAVGGQARVVRPALEKARPPPGRQMQG